MSRIALIRGGVAVNVIDAELAFALSLPGYDTAMEAGTAGPGWLLVAGALVPPPAPIDPMTYRGDNRIEGEKAEAYSRELRRRRGSNRNWFKEKR